MQERDRERERGWGEESVSRRHITLLPNDTAFSSPVWSPSSICSLPSLKIEVLCMLGVQRSTSESGRRITLDGDELCARGSVCVCVCVSVVLCVVCVCVCVRY